MPAALSHYGEGDEVIDQLDKAEAEFAKIAEMGHVNKDQLFGTYSMLDSMLSRLYNGYQQQKEDCLNSSSESSTCDYDQAEKLSLQALYPLSWLHYQGSFLYSGDPQTAKRMLNQAIDGFNQSMQIIISPELLRENLLGRAFCERELGKYDRAEYDKAIADFQKIMQEGQSNQYRAAKQGLATTYAAMGKMDQAAQLTGELGQERVYGGAKYGMEMLHLQSLFKAEAATSDPEKKAQLHRQILDATRGKENNRESWGVILATVNQTVSDPIAEFGHSQDPFELYLLASVLYSKKQYSEAAHYYLEAARSGRYPRAYKYAADIYYNEHRYDQVKLLADEIARQKGNPDAQWAAYMRFKLPHFQWQQSGMKDTHLQQEWVAAAKDYLASYPHSANAYEPRFRLAEAEQRDKDYLQAAKDYSLVSGNTDFEFHARFNAAECYYEVLAKLVNSQPKGSTPDPGVKQQMAQLTKELIDTLDAALRLEPAAERSAPAQRAALHAIRGRAVYMIVTMLERQPKVDYARVAGLLANFESEYPSMKDNFTEVTQWRIQALDKTHNYAELERDLRALVERDQNNPAAADFLKGLGLDFWRASAALKEQGDDAGAEANVRLTVITYGYFEAQVAAGKMEVKDLTGTLSILGKAYIALGDVPKAEAVFSQVVKADPGSPDANAGLARIAQAKKDYRDALELWTRVETVAAQSDDVWYEAKYNVAEIYAAEGNVSAACNKLAVTRSEHPTLGTPEMKAQWDTLQRKICLKGSAS